MIYTTNAIEKLNSVIRKATKAEIISDRSVGYENGFFSDTGGFKKVDHAYSELESGTESLYD